MTADPIHLSPHFSLAELTTTRTGLPNIPTGDALAALRSTAALMEEVRKLLGSRPIEVTSGYRSPSVNKAIGGSRTSDHVNGYAVDFRHTRYTGEECMRILAPAVRSGVLLVDQVIVYATGMIHVSRRPADNRRQVLRSLAASGSSGPYISYVPA